MLYLSMIFTNDLYMFYQVFRSIYTYIRAAILALCITIDFKYVYVLIRFDYVLDSNYIKVLFTIDLMKMIYEVFETLCIYIYNSVFISL